MPRSITFDPEEKLHLAMDLFWKKGYANTSLNDIQKTMGLSRQSMYNTFGDKRELFMKTLDLYEEQIRKDMGGLLTKPHASLSDIKAYIEYTLENTTFNKMRQSCMMANTAVEFSGIDEIIQSRTAKFVEFSRNVLFNALLNAQKNKEISAFLEIETAVNYLITLIHGVGVMSKFGQKEDEILKTVDFAFQLLTDTDS